MTAEGWRCALLAAARLSDRLGSLLVLLLVTGVVWAALRWVLHCPDCGTPV